MRRRIWDDKVGTGREKSKGEFSTSNLTFFPTARSARQKGRWQQAAIKVRKRSSGPIRAKHVNQSSTVIGQYV